jgi:hypothetical protein
MPDLTAAEYAEAQRKNYSEWVAIVPIFINGALAYNPGFPVSSASVVDGTIDRTLIAKVGTKAAEAVAPTTTTTVTSVTATERA